MKPRHMVLVALLAFAGLVVVLAALNPTPEDRPGLFKKRTAAELDSISRLPIEVRSAEVTEDSLATSAPAAGFNVWGYVLQSLAIIALLGIAYFVPSFVAGFRKHPQLTPIFLINLLLGWTVLGWIAALVWSAGNWAAKPAAVTVITGPSPDSVACMKCGKVNGPGKFCTNCGAALGA